VWQLSDPRGGFRLAAGGQLGAIELTQGVASGWIQIAKIGEFQQGQRKFAITPALCDQLAASFGRRVTGFDLAVDIDHDPNHRAIGWFREVQARGDDGLWAQVDWTPEGRQMLANRAFRYFSIEFHPDYPDEEGKRHGPVLLGGGVTNRPFLSGMQPISASATAAANQQGGNRVDPEAITGGMPAVGAQAAPTNTAAPTTAPIAASGGGGNDPATVLRLAEQAALTTQLSQLATENAELKRRLAEQDKAARTARLSQAVRDLATPDASGMVRVFPATLEATTAFVLSIDDKAAEAFLALKRAEVGFRLGPTGSDTTMAKPVAGGPDDVNREHLANEAMALSKKENISLAEAGIILTRHGKGA
jgi:phage I-like protein